MGIHRNKLLATGTWCEDILVTLGSHPELPRYRHSWYFQSWRKLLRDYYRAHPDHTVKYHTVVSRGPEGYGRAGAHVIFEEPLPDLELIEKIWKRRFGVFGISSAGGEATAYQEKNMAEPDAEDEHWRWKVPISAPKHPDFNETKRSKPTKKKGSKKGRNVVVRRRDGVEVRLEGG